MNIEVFSFTGEELDKEIEKRQKKSQANAKNHKTWYGDLDRCIDRKYSKWKSSAKSKGVKFDLSREQIKQMYIIQDGMCPGFGVQMDFDADSHKIITLDQIFPGKGYTLDNVWLTTHMFNIMKNKYSILQCAELLGVKTDLYKKVLDDFINHRPLTHNSDLLLF